MRRPAPIALLSVSFHGAACSQLDERLFELDAEEAAR